MPKFLAHVKPSLVYDALRSELLSSEDNKAEFQFSTNVDFLDKRIQRARYEQFIINLAQANDGYTFAAPLSFFTSELTYLQIWLLALS
jgi:hypothetical protein